MVPDARAEPGEGPNWDAKNTVLCWVDILRGLVHVFEPPRSRDTVVPAGKYVSFVVPKRSDGVAITLQHGFYTLNPKNEVSAIAEAESRLTGNRFNDGRCDFTGRFWAGTMDMEERSASGTLYVLEKNRVRRVLEGLAISNGLGWSRQQYHALHRHPNDESIRVRVRRRNRRDEKQEDGR